jgi:PAS domain S-box-containing protein
MQRILIVEDSPTQAAQLRAIVENAGLEVVLAPDAESALALLDQHAVDLVISDIVMPGMSGYELCNTIKATRRSLPVMLLSTLNEPMDIIRGLECGADNFLTKPYKNEQLLARVGTILQNRSLRAESAVLGIEIMFLGRRFTITSEKEQILDLLISTFEDTVQANRELQRHRTELAAAKIKLEEYAHALEGRIRVSEEKYGLLMENANSAIFVADTHGRVLEANREAATIIGRPLAEIVDRRLAEFVRGESDDAFGDHWAHVIADGSARLENAAVPQPDGTIAYVTITAARVSVGDLDVVQVIWHDITERTRLEEQLRHAQRMEAMGQLTGGIAHDFNNLLGVIIGNLDAIGARKLAPIAEFAENALEAAERGANLIKQLLAFARRQPLNPERIAIPDRLPMTVRLLQSTLGSRFTVEQHIDPDTLPVRADLSQLENAILNLAVNARDAMTEGGRLIIECGNRDVDADYALECPGLDVGRYVTISVSDSGCGMVPDVAAKVFEPFFTTKGAKGTGLGLSQVFGFAKQSGGNVQIYSEVGVGTTVRLYLPAAPDSLNGIAEVPVPEQLESYRGSETILLVEDNDGMREIAEAQLRALGYDVATAEGAATALEVLASERRIDLLLTDIVMPGGLDGRELAVRAREARPNLKVLFTSGFTEAAVAASIQSDFGGAMLSKPYRHADLAKRVRTMLEAHGR